MMKELKYRMANSLQLIASILILKSEAVESPEVRAHLHDAHERILSIATIEQDLYTTSLDGQVEGISLGLIATELIINALKHAFPEGKQGKIVVAYGVKQGGWHLAVSDNGIGITIVPSRKGGLGTTIVQSLARQLGATVERQTGPKGTLVTIERSPVGASGMPLLAP